MQFLGLGVARKWGKNGDKVESSGFLLQREAMPVRDFTAAVEVRRLRPARTAPRRPEPAAGEAEAAVVAAGNSEGIAAADAAVEEEGSKAVAAAASAAAAEQNRRFRRPRCWRSASARCKAPGSATPRP